MCKFKVFSVFVAFGFMAALPGFAQDKYSQMDKIINHYVSNK